MSRMTVPLYILSTVSIFYAETFVLLNRTATFTLILLNELFNFQKSLFKVSCRHFARYKSV